MTNIWVSRRNFTDYDSLKLAADGCDAIIHIVAVTSTNLLHLWGLQENKCGRSIANVIKVANEFKYQSSCFCEYSQYDRLWKRKPVGNRRWSDSVSVFEIILCPKQVEAEKFWRSIEDARQAYNYHPSNLLWLVLMILKPSSGKLMLMVYRKELCLFLLVEKFCGKASDVAQLFVMHWRMEKMVNIIDFGDKPLF